jgi:hypothetical protein
MLRGYNVMEVLVLLHASDNWVMKRARQKNNRNSGNVISEVFLGMGYPQASTTNI